MKPLHPLTPVRTLIALFLSVFVLSTIAADKPNIVVFISDDLGRLDTSVYGSVDAKTPTMELLASKGMTFDHAYVASPSCCPNRYSFLTGLMPARHGAHPNHSKPKPGTKFLPPLFKELGYHVVSFGKVAHGRDGFPGLDFNSPPPTGMSGNVEKYFAGKKIDEPICLFVGDRRPHVTWIKDATYDPDKITLPPYFVDTPETRRHWARYLTDITGMDEEMGRIYEFAKKRFGDNFIFLFTSDHGGQWPMGKWNLYDSSTRIPLIVTWPGKIETGIRTDAMASWVDILPTLLDLADGKVPDDIDGRSFAKILLGKSEKHRHVIFTTHTGDGAMNIFPIRSVRTPQFKYIHNLTPDAWFTNHSDRLRKDGAGAFWDEWDEAAKNDPAAAAKVKAYYTRPEYQFFDMAADPLELDNLVDDPAQRETIAALRSDLDAWVLKQGDDLQAHREPYPVSKPLPDLSSPKAGKKGKKGN